MILEVVLPFTNNVYWVGIIVHKLLYFTFGLSRLKK